MHGQNHIKITSISHKNHIKITSKSQQTHIKITSKSHQNWYCYVQYILCFGDCAKKNQLDAQIILSIFRQLLHVSGVSRPIIRRYKHTYKTNSLLKKIISTNCCIPTVVPPDDGPIYARNM